MRDLVAQMKKDVTAVTPTHQRVPYVVLSAATTLSLTLTHATIIVTIELGHMPLYLRSVLPDQ